VDITRPGAVAHDPDVPVELDVLEALALGLDLERLAAGGLRVGEQLGLAELGVAVDRHLRVQRDDPTVLGEDERVDLEQRRVGGLEPVVELDEELGDLVEEVLAEARLPGDLAFAARPTAPRRVDVDLDDLLGVRAVGLLDLHAALDRGDDLVALAHPVVEDRQVVLLGDVAGRLDEHLLDDVALDVEAEDVLGVLARSRRVGAVLHPARLAATAGEHLRLHHDRHAEALGELLGLLRSGGDLPLRGRRDAVLPEQVLALVLHQVH
jgi:hypothetical protein